MPMDVSHQRESIMKCSGVFMKCSEVSTKCSAVTGNFVIIFAGAPLPSCSLSNLVSFSKHEDSICTLLPPGSKPGWPGHPFLSIHRFITFPKPAPPPSTFLTVALLKASATQSSPQPTRLGCSQTKCRQVSGLRLHLHPAEISFTISVSKQHKLGCLELGSNTATNALRWAGAVPQHRLL